MFATESSAIFLKGREPIILSVVLEVDKFVELIFFCFFDVINSNLAFFLIFPGFDYFFESFDIFFLRRLFFFSLSENGVSLSKLFVF